MAFGVVLAQTLQIPCGEWGGVGAVSSMDRQSKAALPGLPPPEAQRSQSHVTTLVTPGTIAAGSVVQALASGDRPHQDHQTAIGEDIEKGWLEPWWMRMSQVKWGLRSLELSGAPSKGLGPCSQPTQGGHQGSPHLGVSHWLPGT